MNGNTYNIKSKQDGFVWQYQYDLNGNLTAFKILEGSLSDTQIRWLFASGKFAHNEGVMKTVWMKKLKNNFEISVGEPDLSFTSFWDKYKYKIGKRKMAENSWNKMSKAKKIKAMLGIRDYDNYLHRNPGIGKAHATTFLNQEYYENEYKSAI